MKRQHTLLKKWKFAVGDDIACLRHGREVCVPHTWNVEDGTEEYFGTSWYECALFAPAEWKDKRVIVHFHAVYHDATVFLNGKEIGGHSGSGYTPFDVELTDALEIEAVNRLVVKVNNEFSEAMLPYRRSFDWPNDGGIIRDVELWVVGAHYVKELKITAEPVIGTAGERVEKGEARWRVEVLLDGGAESRVTLGWKLLRERDGYLTAGAGTGRTRNPAPAVPGLRQYAGAVLCHDNHAVVETLLEETDYWHFDRPALYTVTLRLRSGAMVEDEVSCTFGFRSFRVEGSQFILNGEPVRLCGTEWMPGSDPAYGMAEPREQIEKMLVCLKESNCIFTRFHWQQDECVYDWCDRHGMLVQEEVPSWGPEPAVPGARQWEIAKQQIGEMVRAHRNHPSIIAWGIGNEMDGQAEETHHYIRLAVDYAHRLETVALCEQYDGCGERWENDPERKDLPWRAGLVPGEKGERWENGPEGKDAESVGTGGNGGNALTGKNTGAVGSGNSDSTGGNADIAGKIQTTVEHASDAGMEAPASSEPYRGRAVNYVSNSYVRGPERDGVALGDIMMINEYTGTWLDGEEHDVVSRIISAHPGKSLVPSEFGLCEPFFEGGDARRTEIFLKKTGVYRQYGAIAGWINFCLNDYRTQIGEEGTGKMRRRVHGSVTLTGEKKPSYAVVQRECAPVVVKRGCTPIMAEREYEPVEERRGRASAAGRQECEAGEERRRCAAVEERRGRAPAADRQKCASGEERQEYMRFESQGMSASAEVRQGCASSVAGRDGDCYREAQSENHSGRVHDEDRTIETLDEDVFREVRSVYEPGNRPAEALGEDEFQEDRSADGPEANRSISADDTETAAAEYPEAETVRITVRGDIPCYSVRGYRLEILDADRLSSRVIALPDLKPGETWTVTVLPREQIAVYRPTGDLVGIY